MNQASYNGVPIVIEKQSITAKPRRLKAHWTIEEDTTIMPTIKKPRWFWETWYKVARRMKWGSGGGWGMSGPWDDHEWFDKLAADMAEEISQEIDNEVLKNLKNQFKHQGS